MRDAIQIITTTDSRAAAEHIARTLVEQRMAACVQIGGPVTSVYRWQGQVECAEEWTCTIKTTADRYSDVLRERFSATTGPVPEGDGGTVTHLLSGVSAPNAGTTLLEGAEAAGLRRKGGV